MAFYLNVCRTQGFNHSITYKFIQHKITLGEDISNNLRLYSSRNLISPIHAEINIENGKYQIVDLGSRTGTYIDKTRLTENQSFDLEDGSEFKIGEYLLTFKKHATAAANAESNFSTIVNEIYYLIDYVEFIGSVNGDNRSANSYEQLRNILHSIMDDSDYPVKDSLVEQTQDSVSQKQLKVDLSDSESAYFIIEMFLKLFITFFDISNQISEEIIHTHTVHRRDSKLLLSPKSLKEYILDIKLTSEEKQKRQNFLRTEIEDLIIRQIALFAGYQNSIKYGVKDLLKDLDPAVIFKAEQEKRIHIGPIGIPQKYLPFLTYQKVFKYLTDIHHNLSNKEQREIEEKYFHPAFINGYLRSANSDQRKFKSR